MVIYMFESLSKGFQKAISNIRGYGKLNETNISDITREIRLALLEADVNYQVVKDFINTVKDKALGDSFQKSLNPGETFIKILKDELVALLGGNKADLDIKGNPSILMLVGLQGSGKTTTIGKLALLLRKTYNKKPLLVACDIYRPAAIDQLKQIGRELNIDVYSETSDPVTIATNALIYAKTNHYDYVLIDTAGRLHIDDELMTELVNINQSVKANEILLVLDAMMGQDAINVINGFNDKLNLTGSILTKMDGDAKGGVALSLRYLTNVPIKYIGTSEKMDGLETFYPERMATRILGMGDLMTMVERAESVIDKDEAELAIKKLNKGKFDLEDFLLQLKQIKKLGPLENIIKLLPQAKGLDLSKVNVDPKQMGHIEAIILSMTKEERKHPEILKASRKIRIAKGSGRTVEEVNRLLKQFEQMKQMMSNLNPKQFKF